MIVLISFGVKYLIDGPSIFIIAGIMFKSISLGWNVFLRCVTKVSAFLVSLRTQVLDTDLRGGV